MINQIIITKKWIDYLEKRNLWNQYKKAKQYLLNWNFTQIKFWLRKPKSEWIYYFRINKQFRVWWYKDWDTLKIFRIDNHQ